MRQRLGDAPEAEREHDRKVANHPRGEYIPRDTSEKRRGSPVEKRRM